MSSKKMNNLIFFVVFSMIFISPFSASAFQVAVVSDIHMGALGCTTYKCGPRAQSALQKVLDDTGDMPVISVGDNMDHGNKADKAKLLNMTQGRNVLWTNGNHDKKVYVSGKEYFSYDINNWRIIVTHSTEINHSKKQYNWLVQQLKTDKKVMIVSHFPIFRRFDGRFIGNYKKVEKLYNQNRDKIKYVLSGHWHEDNWTRVYDGVTYKAIMGLTYNGGTNYEIMNLD